jgi:hypothetical protein
MSRTGRSRAKRANPARPLLTPPAAGRADFLEALKTTTPHVFETLGHEILPLYVDLITVARAAGLTLSERDFSYAVIADKPMTDLLRFRDLERLAERFPEAERLRQALADWVTRYSLGSEDDWLVDTAIRLLDAWEQGEDERSPAALLPFQRALLSAPERRLELTDHRPWLAALGDLETLRGADSGAG